MAYFFLIILIIVEAIADIISKEWSLKGGILLGSIALSVYLLANVFWLGALKNGAELAKGAIFFSVGSGILAVMIGVGLYKEVIGKYEIIGVILGILSIAFLSIGEN
jgi:hypothetical protein